MSNNVGLTPEQLYEVTGRKRARNQIEALTQMGIDYRIRPNGTPFVALSAINEYTQPQEPIANIDLSQL